MSRQAEPTRARIIDAAYRLFYRKGFARVSVDEIAVSTGVTKRTLYYHFRSKDELLESVLETQHELALARFREQGARYSGSPSKIVSTLFADLAAWSETPGWTGAGFTRVVMELADLPGHPARAVARRHKAEMEVWWVGLLRKAGVASPRNRAREVVLLMEGAMVMILIHGDRKYAAAASRAAGQLVRTRARSGLCAPET